MTSYSVFDARNPFWHLVFKAGVSGWGIIFLTAFIVSIARIAGAETLPIGEGDAVVRYVMSISAGVTMISSFVLWLPNFASLARRRDLDSFDRYSWFLGLLLFPFIASFIYFRKVRAESKARPT